ncbi:MAG: DUF4062 domain-containing protein [Candidatus Cloacimonetes bacterium]|nr:DUF4062 domain-containing protein [Candidatus Cloacimonadota bacterium]
MNEIKSDSSSHLYRWITQRIFISSTFSDFHAERDYLIKYVFPELREKYEKYKIHIRDIDLRWGVTKEEAESGKVIELCLEQIDNCRPFFICMLGNRYGYEPDIKEKNKVDPDIFKIYPELERKWTNISVTHLEILHAVISPLHRKEKIPHSFFFFRDENCIPRACKLSALSEKQKKIFEEAYFEIEETKKKKLERLKGIIEDHFESIEERIFPYKPIFDENLSNPENDELHGRFTKESLKEFGNTVKKQLEEALDVQFEKRIKFLKERREQNFLEIERDYQEVFIENRTETFIGREELLLKLHEYVKSDSSEILAVYGESGCGKSALLAKFYKDFKFDNDYNELNEDVFFIPHFIGASPVSTSKHGMLRRFCEEIFERFFKSKMEEKLLSLSGNEEEKQEQREEIKKEYEVPFDPNLLAMKFKDYLEKVNNKLVILIDGLNQLDDFDKAQELDWLPLELPANVKIIASTLEGAAKESLNRFTTRQLKIIGLNFQEKEEIIRKTPSVFAKTIEDDYIKLLVEKESSGNPLYLKISLEEMRLFGSFDKLEGKIDSLPAGVIEIFIAVIKRLENDFDSKLVEAFFCLLECSKFGLLNNELEELLEDNRKDYLVILRQLRDYFISRDGVNDFFHRGLSKAVRKKYNLEKNAVRWHRIIAYYFEKGPFFFDGNKQKDPNFRKCLEQPWQQTKGEMWDEVTDTLCNLYFIQAKCAAGMTYELLNDFNYALAVLPENEESIRIEKERQAKLYQYSEDLVLYAKSKTIELDIPECVPLKNDNLEREIPNVKSNQDRIDYLKDFNNFLGQEADNLHMYVHGIPNFAIQQAWNYSNAGPVAKTSEKISPEIQKEIMLCSKFLRPSWNPFPVVLKTLKRHTDSIYDVSITANGKRGISASRDLTCKLWDLDNGEVIKTLKGHTRAVTSVSITANGRLAFSGSWDKTCKLWDMDIGKELRTLEGHTDIINAVSMTNDGKRALSGSRDETCILWDLETGEQLKTLKGHKSSVSTVCFSLDSKRALSGSEDNTCKLWNLDSGTELKTFEGHTRSVTSVCITADGKRAISGSVDKTCIIWNLDTGEHLKTLKGHTDIIRAVSISADGKRALSGSSDKTCILWDLETGEQLKTLKGHTSSIHAVSISADGKRALSGSSDDTCKLWDLTGEELEMDKWHMYSISSISVTSGGKRVFSGSFDYICEQAGLDSGDLRKMLARNYWANQAVCISVDGKRALSVWGIKLKLWDLDRMVELNTFKGHKDIIEAVSISPDGKQALSGSWDKTCILWDLDQGVQLKTLKGHRSVISSICISSDGLRALSGSKDGKCILWDLDQGVQLKTLKGHTSSIHAVSISADGKRALSGSSDDTCKLWDLESGALLRTLKGHTDPIESVSFSDIKNLAFSVSWNNTCILWNLDNGEILNMLKGHTRGLKAVSISSDGKRALSGSGDKTCKLWRIENGDLLKTLIGHTSFINAVSITNDGKRALSGSADYTCILWNLNTEMPLKRLKGHTGSVTSVSISPDGKRAISGSEDTTCKLWNLDRGTELKTFEGHTRSVTSVCITADGKRAISGSEDYTCKLWNLDNGKLLKTLKGHTDRIMAVSISSDGLRALSGSSDETCILWDIKSGEIIKTLKGHTDVVNSVCISLDGNRAISGSNDKTCIFWDLNSGKKIAQLLRSTSINDAKIFLGIFWGGEDNGEFFSGDLGRNFLCSGIPIITIIKTLYNTVKIFNHLSARCPYCGHCFSPPRSVLKAIKRITTEARLLPDQSPCLELPDKYWDDPRLISECPKCHEKLKFNPFVVDNSGGED